MATVTAPATGAPPQGHRFTGIGDFPAGLTRYDALQDVAAVIRVEEPDGGYWVCLDRELAVAALQDSEAFSNALTTPFQDDSTPVLPPVMLDPPDHGKWRRLLNPFFNARRVQELEERVRARTQELLDELAPRGECDFVKEFAFQLPTVIFLEMVGLPPQELATFLTWLAPVVHPDDATGTLDRDAAGESMANIAMLFSEVLAERRADPASRGDDLISHMVTWEIDGRALSDGELLLCGVLLFIAGLDTVANAMAYTVRHLATHPDDRARVAVGELPWADVAEEMLRSYAIPEISRMVVRDVELGGQQLRAGEVVLFPLVAINRDPRHVERGREVDLSRPEPPVNLAFGTGAHRCLGVHLARLEMRVFLEMWHARIPDYRLAQEALVREYWGPVHGMKSLPLRWDVA